MSSKFLSREESWNHRRMESVTRYQELFEKTKNELDTLNEKINDEVYKRVRYAAHKLEVVEEDIETKNKVLAIDMHKLQQVKMNVEEFREASMKVLSDLGSSLPMNPVKDQAIEMKADANNKQHLESNDSPPPLLPIMSFLDSGLYQSTYRGIETVDKYKDKQKKQRETNFPGLNDKPNKVARKG